MEYDFLIVTIGNTEIYKIAPEIIKRGYSVAVISGSPKHIKDDVDPSVPYWHINDLIKRYNDKINFDDETVKLLKERYHIPSIHSFYFPHFYYRMSQCDANDFYDLSNQSVNAVLYKKTLETFQAIEFFFNDNNIKNTIQNMGGEILRRVIYHHNKSLGIPNLIFSWSPLPGHYVIISNEEGRWEDLKLEKYEKLSSSELERAVQFIAHFKNQGSIINLRQPLEDNQIKNVLGNVKIKRNNLSLRSICYFLKYIHKTRKYNSMFVESNFQEKFLFFPLHYHAESRITLRDPHCWRQEFIVEYVARSIPNDVKLYVKPHPEWPLDFPYEGLKLISKIKNVKLLRPDYSSSDLIKKSEGVIVINSNAGFEALIYDKPVIAFGTEFYTGKGLTNDVNDMRKLPEIIHNALNSTLNRKKLICFVDSFLKVNRKGNLSIMDNENIELLTEGILEYKSN